MLKITQGYISPVKKGYNCVREKYGSKIKKKLNSREHSITNNK